MKKNAKQTAVFQILALFIIAFFLSTKADAGEPLQLQLKSYTPKLSYNIFLRDSLAPYSNFPETNNNSRIKPYIAPAGLIAVGTILHFSTDSKYRFQNWAQQHIKWNGAADDYLRYAPLAAVYALNLVGNKGENNFGNRTAIAIKILLINELITSTLKTTINETRPNGGKHSFPSGHTSVAFTLAHFMHKEFGNRSVWYSIGAYGCATTVAFMRIAKNAHWISDVVAGAGLGILSTELVYLTHLYKWDNKHLRNLDILPFRHEKKNGITLVYKF